MPSQCLPGNAMSPQQVDPLSGFRANRLIWLEAWWKCVSTCLLLVLLVLAIDGRGICEESASKRLAGEADQALRAQNYDLAIKDYKEILRASPSSAAVWSNLGSAWVGKGRIA